MSRDRQRRLIPEHWMLWKRRNTSTSYESSSGPSLPLSTRARKEYAAVREQQTWYEQLPFAESPEVEFESELPYIVGFVPENEREFFTTFMGDVTTYALADHIDTKVLIAGMPKTLQMMVDDAQKIDPSLHFLSWSLDRKQTAAGDIPREAAGKWHIDGFSYLISSDCPTEFYGGRAVVNRPTLHIKQESLDQNAAIIAAPPFAIVRKGQKTLHRSPRFSRDARRTFMLFNFVR